MWQRQLGRSCRRRSKSLPMKKLTTAWMTKSLHRLTNFLQRLRHSLWPRKSFDRVDFGVEKEENGDNEEAEENDADEEAEEDSGDDCVCRMAEAVWGSKREAVEEEVVAAL